MARGEAICTPCGGCRQKIREFGNSSTRVLCYGPGSARNVYAGGTAPSQFRAGSSQVSDYEKAARQIRAMARSHSPEIGIILGSGLAGVATDLDDAVVMPYSEIEGFPEAGVQGHAGQLVIGRQGGRSVACLQGRWHAYEGHNLADIALPIRALKALGCQSLLITCAAGSLQKDMPPGSLMMLTDHINWPGLSPLIGPNTDEVGPRFTRSIRCLYSEAEVMRKSAAHASIHLHEGVYLWCLGPSFETPASYAPLPCLVPMPWGCQQSLKH